MTHISVNGLLLKSGQPNLFADDRAFRYGDALFETLRIHHGLPAWWNEHLARLASGGEALGIPIEHRALRENSLDLIAANAVREGVLRIAISRGRGGRGYLPPSEIEPVTVIETLPLPSESTGPITACLSRYRKIPPACLPTEVKTAQGLNSILAMKEAADAGHGEALQLSVSGAVAGFASGNLFWRREGRVFTPALTTGCLSGVTRNRLMALLGNVTETESPLEELAKAGAVIRTNSIGLALGIRSIEGLGRYSESAGLAGDWRRMLEVDMEQEVVRAS